MGSLGQLPGSTAKPVIIVVSGLPGTGKTYFSGRLAERLGYTVLESDALRKVLFSPPSYSPVESQRLFGAIHVLIEKLLKKGVSLILDATNLSERHREQLYNIADRAGAGMGMVRVEAPPEVVRRRLESRTDDPDNRSDAGWLNYKRMKASEERITRSHYVIDTSRDITPVLDKIEKRVKRLNLSYG